MNILISPVETDELVLLIYRGPLGSPPWHGFLEALRARLDADMAAIALRPGRRNSAPVTTLARRSDSQDRTGSRKAAAAHSRLALEDPLNQALAREQGPLTLGEIVPREDLVRTDFYKQVVSKFHIDHQIGMAITEPSGWRSHVGLMNALEREDFGSEHKAFLASLRQHLECALEIYARLVRTWFSSSPQVLRC